MGIWLNVARETMTIEYVNRKSQTYYLHQGTTKTGKPRYFFSQKTEGNLASEIPDGYEIYENPHAQVFLRKIPIKLITDEELEIIKKGLAEFCEVKLCKIDVKKEIVTVFAPDKDWANAENLPSMFSQGIDQSIVEYLALRTNYEAVMRFVLTNLEERLFLVQRYCYRGSIDDWIDLDEGDLSTIIKEYIKHIGQESYFDLY